MTGCYSADEAPVKGDTDDRGIPTTGEARGREQGITKERHQVRSGGTRIAQSGLDAGLIEMNLLQVIAFVAIALGAALSLGNWLTLYFSWKRKRFVSAVPLLGALLLGLGLAYFPATRKFAWASVIADYGTLSVIVALPTLINELWATAQLNLLRSFLSRHANRTVELKLFKHAIFTVTVTYDPPIPCNPHGAKVSSVGFQGKWNQDGSAFILRDYCGDRELWLRPEADHFVSVETHYPNHNEYSYDSLTMLTFTELKA